MPRFVCAVTRAPRAAGPENSFYVAFALATPQPIEVDGVQVLIASAAEMTEQFLARLESRTGDLIDETSVDEPEQEQLRSYSAIVKAAQ